MSSSTPSLKLAFYGDDFTGSTDALDFLARAGVRTVLFIDPPDGDRLSKFPGIEAVGVAGMSRSLPAEEMRPVLEDAFSRLKALKPEFVHYKVCSTFDSSPETGNIGTAIEIGSAIFATPCVPILVGNPLLGRYCLFGNLFARMATGDPHSPMVTGNSLFPKSASTAPNVVTGNFNPAGMEVTGNSGNQDQIDQFGSGEVYRIDRHPSMSRHPVTPARDGDLRDHLARQAPLQTGLIDILTLRRPFQEQSAALEQLLRQQTQAVFFDVLEEADFSNIGRLLHTMVRASDALFLVGSSGIETALCRYWEESGTIRPAPKLSVPGSAGPILVASGSCSPVTGNQIDTAVRAGFAEIAVDVTRLLQEFPGTSYPDALVEMAAEQLQSGVSVILHTSRGPDDPRLVTGNWNSDNLTASLGTCLGKVVLRTLEKYPLNRIGFAGGDSSSQAARAMRIHAVEMAAPFLPGAPLCLAHADNPQVDGIQINFKGGQVGPPDYFIRLRDGASG